MESKQEALEIIESAAEQSETKIKNKKKRGPKNKAVVQVQVASVVDSKQEEHKQPQQIKPKKENAPKPDTRGFAESDGGHYDSMGFYILPDNKGFYDLEGYYFNGDGYDEFGGSYDDEGHYHKAR